MAKSDIFIYFKKYEYLSNRESSNELILYDKIHDSYIKLKNFNEYRETDEYISFSNTGVTLEISRFYMGTRYKEIAKDPNAISYLGTFYKDMYEVVDEFYVLNNPNSSVSFKQNNKWINFDAKIPSPQENKNRSKLIEIVLKNDHGARLSREDLKFWTKSTGKYWDFKNKKAK